MLEYVILLLFIILMFHPLQMNPLAKGLELVLLVYAGYKSPLIGLLCAIVFVYSLHLSGQLPKIKSMIQQESIPLLSEKMKPQDSNSAVFTEKTIDTTYLPNESYQAYNVEV